MAQKRISKEEALLRAESLLGAPENFVLGIVGKPGVGKSTFTQNLLNFLKSDRVAVVPMDGFHLSNEELVKVGKRERKGAPDTFDVQAFVKLLQLLKKRNGSEVIFPTFDRETETSIPGGGRILPSATLVVVEGNYLLHADDGWGEVKNYFDETWYLDLNENVRKRRLIDRHIFFGKSPIEAAAWVENSDEKNALLIGVSRTLAGIVVVVD
jgi:pantothenate kinase